MAEDNILASNLAQLGGQISSTFQNVALQNQYKNALPGIQQAFQSAMTDFDAGRSGAGFSKIMAVAMENPNNPMIQNISQMAFKAGQFASDDYFKSQTIDVARAKGGGRQLTQEEVDAFNEFGTDGDTSTDYTTTVTTPSQPAPRTGLPATQQITQPRIGKDGVAIVTDVNAPDGLPTKTGNEPPQVDLITPLSETDIVGAQASTASQIRPQQVDDTYQLKEDEQKYDASFLQKYGLDIDTVVGKRVLTKQEQELSIKKVLGGNTEKTLRTKDIKENEAKALKLEALYDKLQTADRTIQSSKTLKEIVRLSGNDLDNVDLDIEGEKESAIYTATIRNPDGTETSKELSSTQYEALRVIKVDSGNASDIKFTVPKPKAKSETQRGLPAAQPPPVAPQIPEAAGNPFAAKLETIQKTETVEGKKKVVQEVSRVIETVTRLEQTLAGLAKGEMPETIDYLPRAKKAALQGTDLAGLKKEFNILANLKPAIEWVKKNPNDPKAAQAAEAIRQQLGI
jgi:hypothetical protein